MNRTLPEERENRMIRLMDIGNLIPQECYVRIIGMYVDEDNAPDDRYEGVYSGFFNDSRFDGVMGMEVIEMYPRAYDDVPEPVLEILVAEC